MTPKVAPEFVRFINEERQANRLPALKEPLREGETFPPVLVDHEHAIVLLRVAARLAVGLDRPSEHTEVLWVHGDSQLAINLTEISMKLTNGLLLVYLPVRCDQTGAETIEVGFAVGTAEEPTGLYASTYRRPNGPAPIVDAWGEMLIAFAWQCVLGMISEVVKPIGRDESGEVLVPVELTASQQGLQIVPMARHRFSGPDGGENGRR